MITNSLVDLISVGDISALYGVYYLLRMFIILHNKFVKLSVTILKHYYTVLLTLTMTV